MRDEYMMDDKLNINWYPGHMKKTKELMLNNLKLIDVVVEILDSRIPYSSKNPDIDSITNQKPRVIALNKCDIADQKKTEQWVEYYRQKNMTAIPIDANKGTGVNTLIKACREAVKEKLEKLAEKGIKNRAIRIMIVGVPNAGKSSLINRLSGRRSTQTGDRPGVTKGKQWVKLKGDMELLDTPGILWPKFEDYDVALNLAFTRAIKDEVLDIETLALRLVERLVDIAPQALITRYKLDTVDNRTPLEVMEDIGRKRGFKAGGNEIDYTRCAQTILNEFREGKMGRITLEVPEDFE